jgi:thiol-disulfide isomerase/thioredoxin
MSLHSILHKISRATDPTRFVEPGKAAPAVWSSIGRVVDEQFVKTTVSEEAGHVIYERRAVATDLGRPESVTELSIKREVRGGESSWAVSLKDGQKIILSRSGEASVMIALYKKLYSSMTMERPSGRAYRFVLGGVAGLVVLYIGLAAIGHLLAPSSSNDLARAQYGAPVAMATEQFAPPELQPPVAAAPAAQQNSSDNQLTDAERKDINKRAHRVSLGGAGDELVVFSDPNCPYCQRLEAEIEELASKKEGKVTLIPVAFKSGSREAVAAVLCSKDQAAAWKKAVNGEDIGAKACEAGLKKVDQNNKLFADLKMAATPTLITPKGLILASYANIDQLRQLMKL